MKNEIIIIPDIHGRIFWKKIVEKYSNYEIIFLGDYLDPYPYEMGKNNITKESVIENFKDIIEFKKQHIDTVTLLLGNHDCMTYIFPLMGQCRTDMKNRKIISELFLNNINLFKFGYYKNINKLLYTFSHGAILQDWVKKYPYIFKRLSPINVINVLNNLLLNIDKNKSILSDILNNVSGYRDSYSSDSGSIVWGDVRELPEDKFEWLDTYQIIGHTQLKKPLIGKYYADLDSRRGFILDIDTGEIKEIKELD